MQDARYVSTQKPPIFSGLRLFKGQPKPPPPPPKDIPPSTSTLSLPLSDSSSYKEPATNISPYRSPSPSSSTTSHPTHTLTTKKSLFKLPGLNRSKSYAPSTGHDDNAQEQHETPDPNVSAPWNFQHDLHVDDGFIGLPPTWLSQAGLSAQDVEDIVSRRRQQAQYAKMAPLSNAAPTTPSSEQPTAPHVITSDTYIGPPPSYSTPLSDYVRPSRGEIPPLSSRDAPKRKQSLSRREKVPQAAIIPAPAPPHPSISPKPSFTVTDVPILDEEDQSPRTAVLPPRLTLSQDRISGDWSESLFSALPSEVGGGFDGPAKGRSPSPPRLPPLADLGLGANTISGQSSRKPLAAATAVNPIIVRTGSPPIVSVRPLNLAPKSKTQAALLQSAKAKALAAKKVDEDIVRDTPASTTTITVTPAPSNKRAGPPKPLTLPPSSSNISEQRQSILASSTPSDASPQQSPQGPSVPRSKSSPTGSHILETASPSNTSYQGLSPTDSYYYGNSTRSPGVTPSPSASSFDDRSPSSVVFVQVGSRLDLPKVRPRHEPTESVSSTTLSYLLPQTPVTAYRAAQPTEERPKPNGNVPLLSVSSHKDKDDRLASVVQPKKPQSSRRHLSEAMEDAAAGSFLEEWLLDDSNDDGEYESGETLDQDSVPFTASTIAQQFSRMRVPQTPMGDALPDSPFVTSPLPREQQEPASAAPTPQPLGRKGAPGRHVPPKLNLLRPARVVPAAFKLLEDEILPDDPNSLFGDLDMVGEGESGSVYSVRIWAEDPNATRTVAIKKVQAAGDIAIVKVQSLQRELQIMRDVQHLHILSMEGLFLSGEALWIKMELMERSLADLLELNPAGLQIEERHLARFSNDMLSALAHLADKRVAHRDLRSDNLLINQQGLLKLADFSNAVEWTSANCMRTEPVGLIPWQAPEVRSGKYNVAKVDVWSVGATIWEVIESAPPFLDDVQEGREPGDRWPSLSQPENYSSALHEFLRLCSEPSSSRPTPQKLLQSQFIKRSCTRGDILDLLSQAQSIESGDQEGLGHEEDRED